MIRYAILDGEKYSFRDRRDVEQIRIRLKEQKIPWVPVWGLWEVRIGEYQRHLMEKTIEAQPVVTSEFQRSVDEFGLSRNVVYGFGEQKVYRVPIFEAIPPKEDIVAIEAFKAQGLVEVSCQEAHRGRALIAIDGLHRDYGYTAMGVGQKSELLPPWLLVRC